MGKLLINLVIDKSGSMGGPKRAATIEAVNAFLDAQRGETEETLLSETQFDTTYDVKFVAQRLEGIPPFGQEGHPYVIGGGTALLDAVATTIKGVEAWLAKHEFDGRVLTVIQTDGEENSSREWTLTAVNDLIERKRKEGWEFVFMGAGADAWQQGNQFTSIPTENRFDYEGGAHSTAMASAAMTSSSLTYRGGGSVANVTYVGAAKDDDDK
jgi:hypothetical protein